MAGDASFASVSTLLHFDGANGSTVFTDKSANPKVYTPTGAPVISTAQSVFGGSSLSLNGASYLSTPAVADFLLGAGDFTVECRVRLNALSAQKFLGIWSDTTGFGFSWKLECTGAGLLQFTYSTTGGNSTAVTAGSGAVAANTWAAVCCMRLGNTIYLFVNGVMVGSAAAAVTLFAVANTKLFEVGHDGAGNLEFVNGFIDEVRVTKGVARYSAAGYAVATSAFPDGLGQISGTVTDNAGAPAARIVRAYRRDTGALVGSTTSDGTTGAFSIYTPTLDEVDVITLDSATTGTIYDDLIDRVIPA